jgi:Stage II sporulation protein E (SpoIIE)
VQAVHVFESSRASSPPVLVEELHQALRATRGAAVAVAAVDLEHELVKFAGLGNIGASIITPDVKRLSLVSQNGTAGHAARRINEFSYPFRAGSILVMFTDGLMSGWDASAYSALWSYDPAIIAGVLYRDFSRRRDDVTVVIGTSRSTAHRARDDRRGSAM